MGMSHEALQQALTAGGGASGPSGPDPLADVLREYMSVTERLQTTHETLQREVIRLREELASKDRELERRRRLAALGELAAGVAHEVRNPLGAIQLYSGLLKTELAQLHAAGAQRLIEKIESGVAAIDGVVRDTLALAPRSGRVATVAVEELFGKARDVCGGVLEQHGVTLECTQADPRLVVHGHPDGIQRVLVNLISNAVQASPPGSTVRVHAAADADVFVRVVVSDEGIGLADDVIDRIFDPFFTTKPTGTGLGLTIAHRLIEAHGGQLSGRNGDAGGAIFEFTLPAVAAADSGADAKEGGRQTSAA
jgi:signal transduction histidine kinase